MPSREKDSLYHDQLPANRFTDSSQKQKFFVIAALFMAIFIYAGFQFFYLFRSPKLEIVYPKDQNMLSEPIVEISGYSQPTANVFINKNLIFPDKNGFFKKEAVLQSGLNTFTFEAVNSFGRKSEKVIRVVYQGVEESAKK